MVIFFSDNGELYNNGDDLTIGGWVKDYASSGTIHEYSNDKAYQGSKSLKFSRGTHSTGMNYWYHTFTGAELPLKAIWWMYDNGETGGTFYDKVTGTFQLGMGDWIKLGVIGSQDNETKYGYHSPETGIVYSTVDRSIGWHKFEINALEDGAVTLKIDEQEIASIENIFNPNYPPERIYLRSKKNTAGFYFDDIIIESDIYKIGKTLPIIHVIAGSYNYKQDDTWIISGTYNTNIELLYSLKHCLSKSCNIIPSFSGIPIRTLEATMNIVPEIHSTLRYKLLEQKNILFDLLPNIEVTRIIGTSGVGNLLSYRVTQEWQAPYDIAELRYKSIPIFEVGDYIQIEQEDFIVEDPDAPPNKIKWVVFRGPAIGIDKTYKKNFEETTIKAVSNEWYLTKQFCFWDAKFTENLSFLKDVNGKDYVRFFLGGIHSWSNFTDKYGLGDHWEWITGIDPEINVDDAIPDWDSNWKAYTKVFNFPFGKRKLDAIRDLCHNCDYAFYCLYGHDSYNWGRRLGYFRARSKVYNDSLWPFGVLWRIDIDADDGGGFNDRLLEIRSRESQTTDDTKINRVAMGASISLGEYFIVRREQEGVGTYKEGIKPVEEYQGIQAEDWANLNANSSELYDTLRKTNVTYEAKLLSLVSTYPYETPICPGMQIRFTNVEGHPEDTFRIKKITHERGSGDPVATTTIEYQDFDLIKGGSPKLNEIASILNDEENKIEKGDKILGYPATKDPRSLRVGEKTGIDVGEITAYNESENTVDIKIYSTNQVVEGVPVV